MIKTSFLLFILAIVSLKSYSQTENFLKLNRIIVIDSLKSVISTSATGTKTDLYKITVPDNVYWKVNHFSISARSGISYSIRVNESYISPASPAGNYLEKTTPIWIKPNSIIVFEGVWTGNPIGVITITSSMYLSGEEFIVGP